MNEENRERVSFAGAALVSVCHAASRNAGWWTAHGIDIINLIKSPPSKWDAYCAAAIVSQKLMLSVSELAEGMEGHRKGKMDDHLPHRPSLEVELADTVIRIADLAGALGLDLGGAIAEKLAFNAQRADHTPAARAAEGGKAY